MPQTVTAHPATGRKILPGIYSIAIGPRSVIAIIAAYSGNVLESDYSQSGAFTAQLRRSGHRTGGTGPFFG